MTTTDKRVQFDPIVEHLCGLDQLPINDFRFFAVAAKVKGMGTFPVRAFATLGA